MRSLVYWLMRYKLCDEFAEILQLREDTRPGIVMALWQYIKVPPSDSQLTQFHNLQAPDEKRYINLDAKLAKLFGPVAPDGRIYFPQIPDLMNRFLEPAEPIVLNYVVRVDKQSSNNPPQSYDVDLTLDHPIRNRMSTILSI